MSREILIAIGFFIAFSTGTANALGDAAWGYSYDFTHDWVQADLVRRATAQATSGSSYGSSKKERKTIKKLKPLEIGTSAEYIAPDGKLVLLEKTGPEKLARHFYSSDDFRLGRAIFIDLITSFNKNVEDVYGVPKNNLATAVAVALAGSHAAYTGRILPDTMVAPLVKQLETSMQNNLAPIENLSQQQKILLYQVLVGSGMWFYRMQASLDKAGDDERRASLKKTARKHFMELSGLDPDYVEFAESGMYVIPKKY